MYSACEFGLMVADTVRMAAYAEAIKRAVKPGDVVVDLGAGTGVFSILAAQAGARKVHAIEPNPAVSLLPALARSSGVADRIVVHEASSFDVHLQERASVIVSDLRGPSPLVGEHVRAIVDARERLLAPGGTLLPRVDRLQVALAEATDMWRSIEPSWQAFEPYGISAEPMRDAVLNSVHIDRARVTPSDLLSTPRTWATLDYATYRGEVIEADLDFTAVRSGTLRGLSVWFDATITDGIGFSNAPGNNLVYPRIFLPLLAPCEVEGGATVNVSIRADARGSRWAWDIRTGITNLRQTTALALPLSVERFARLSPHHQPHLSTAGQLAKAVLAGMDGRQSLDSLMAIARETSSSSMAPELIAARVRDIIERFGA